MYDYYDNYPYGEEITSTNNDTFKFAQTYRDSDSGLDYATHRYYASAVGRFLSPDPTASASTKLPQSWNQYAYAGGDPVNNYDPSGTCYSYVDETGNEVWVCDSDFTNNSNVPTFDAYFEIEFGNALAGIAAALGNIGSSSEESATPCSITAQSILSYMQTTKAANAQGWKRGRPCAGINRQVVGDERALQERSSDSILTSSLAQRPSRGGWRSVDRGIDGLGD
jgi:RHS repeat-associated protein